VDWPGGPLMQAGLLVNHIWTSGTLALMAGAVVLDVSAAVPTLPLTWSRSSATKGAGIGLNLTPRMPARAGPTCRCPDVFNKQTAASMGPPGQFHLPDVSTMLD